MRRFTRRGISSMFPSLLAAIAASAPAWAEDEPGHRVETGALEDGDLRLSSGEFHDDYLVDGKAGALVILDLHSPDFNAFIQISPRNTDGPNAGREWHNEDFSKSTTDAGLAVTLPEDGEYDIFVTTSTAGESGRYDLGITLLPAPSQVELGQLADDDRQLDSGEFCDYFEFEARQGELWVAEVISEDFNTYLFGRSVDDKTFQIDNDDSFGNERNSQVLMRIPRDGKYFVGVTSALAGETGEYRIMLSSTAAVGVPPRVDVPEGIVRGARSLGGETRAGSAGIPEAPDVE